MSSLCRTNKKKILILILLISTSLFLIRDILTERLQQVFSETEENKDEIIILYTNNEHGFIGNFAKIGAKKDKLEEEYQDVFLVSTGNSFSGDPIVNHYRKDDEEMRGKPMIELMNLVDYDLLNLGKYDFDYGQSELKENIDQANFPVITSNLKPSSQSELEEMKSHLKLKTDSGRDILFLGLMEGCIREYSTFYENNFSGLKLKELNSITDKYSNLTDEIDLTILLSNIKHQYQTELADRTDFVDLIISGVENKSLESPKEVNNSLITKGDNKTNSLGKIKIELVEDEVEEISSELIAMPEIEEEKSEVKEVIDDYYEQLDEIMLEEITTLERTIEPGEEMGNLVTDSIREKFNLDVALHSLGGIRNNNLEKEVIMKEIYQLLPFSEEVLIFDLTEEELKEVLKDSYRQREKIDFSISGIKYDIILDQAANLKEIRLRDEKDEPTTEQSYELGVNKQVALRYDLKEKIDNPTRSISPRAITDIVIEYLENNKLDLDKIQEQRTKIEVETDSDVSKESELFDAEDKLETVDKDKGSVTAVNLITDAFVSMSKADIALFRNQHLAQDFSLSANKVNQELLNFIYNSFADDNNLITFKLSGNKLKELLLKQIRDNDNQAAIQVSSNLSYELIFAEDELVDLVVYFEDEEIEPDEKYKIVANNFDFSIFTEELSQDIQAEILNITEEEALLDYLSKTEINDDLLTEARIKISD